MQRYRDFMLTTAQDVLTERETALYTRMSAGWLRKRRRLGLAPPYVRISGRIRYMRSDLDALIQRGRIDPARATR